MSHLVPDFGAQYEPLVILEIGLKQPFEVTCSVASQQAGLSAALPVCYSHMPGRPQNFRGVLPD